MILGYPPGDGSDWISFTPDLIIVLKDGEVVEQGTHEELMRAGGLYYSMWLQQASDTYSDADKQNTDDEGA